VAINALLLLDACAEWPVELQRLFTPWAPVFAEMMLWLAVLMTAVSGAIYLWRNRALYLNDM
jgi:hypothetical protein